MHRRRYLSLAGLAVSGLAAGCLGGEADPPTGVAVETVVDGLSHPWAMAFTPDGSGLFVTERDDGTLSRVGVDDGSIEAIDGVPTVESAGQGGLLDVTLHPRFPDEPWLYLTYSATDENGDSTTVLGRGAFDSDAGELVEFEPLYVAEPFVDSTAHFGSRVVFGPDGLVYVTVGDRQFKNFGPEHDAQNLSNDIGTTLRVAPDGSIPADNPFGDDPAVRDAIYSYGHRNVQGMTVHPETGDIWQADHGEEDGDALYIVEQGGNHGWPVAHYGCEYGTDEPVGDRPDERDDIVDPVYYWECESGGFPPSGMTFYTGEAFPDWQGDLFVGTLAGEYLGRFSVTGREVDEREPLLSDAGWRIRDVAVAPETGELYVAVDDRSAPIVRLVPE